MQARDLDRWVEGYRRAWESNDPDDIRALFTETARYFTAPFRDPWEGHNGIIEGWLERKDHPGEWAFRHEVLATCDDFGFVRGWTDYPRERERYSNLWVIRLDAHGRCTEFTEWWMKET